MDMRWRLPAALGLLLSAGVDSVVAQPAPKNADPFIGTWVLNRAMSTFEPGPAPQRRITTFEMVGDALRHVTRTSSTFRTESAGDGLGGTDTVEYTARFDGKDYPITNSVLSTVSIKRIDARTVERTGKIGGQIVETSTREVSPDGQRLTITTKGVNDGTEYSSVQIFDRAKP
jgi:hypothetical protein